MHFMWFYQSLLTYNISRVLNHKMTKWLCQRTKLVYSCSLKFFFLSILGSWKFVHIVNLAELFDSSMADVVLHFLIAVTSLLFCTFPGRIFRCWPENDWFMVCYQQFWLVLQTIPFLLQMWRLVLLLLVLKMLMSRFLFYWFEVFHHHAYSMQCKLSNKAVHFILQWCSQ